MLENGAFTGMYAGCYLNPVLFTLQQVISPSLVFDADLKYADRPPSFDAVGVSVLVRQGTWFENPTFNVIMDIVNSPDSDEAMKKAVYEFLGKVKNQSSAKIQEHQKSLAWTRG